MWRNICGVEMVVAFMSCQEKKKRKEKPDSKREKCFISVHFNHSAKMLYIMSLCKNHQAPHGSPALKEDNTVSPPPTPAASDTLCKHATWAWTAEGFELGCHSTPSPLTVSWAGSALVAGPVLRARAV